MKPSNVGEERREELPAGAQRDVAFARQDRLGESRREVALQPRGAFELRDLRVDRCLQVGVEGVQIRVERCELFGGAVEVVREVAELVAVGDRDPRCEVAVRDPGQTQVDGSNRPDHRPREDRAQGQSTQQRDPGESRDRQREESPVPREGFRLGDRPLLRIGDERVERVLEHM